MDLGISGKTAIVCGASKGLGKGCAMALAKEGARIVINARDAATLEKTAGEIRAATGIEAKTVAADVTTAEGRMALLRACPDPDILVTNAGGPPAGELRAFGEEEWHRAVQANMITPILLIKAVVDGMVARRFGRIVNITSSTVKMPYASLALSNGARTGLTGAVASLARDVVKHGVTINSMLPGSHETDRLRSLVTGGAASRGISADEALRLAKEDEVAKRFGTVGEFGAICAFLCSVHTGYITGQSILIDGGSYPGTL